MLSHLVVHNFAILRHLEVSFEPGLNVITGETGAGKSILVGAVNLILGGRASQEMIRTGQQEARVEALFLIGQADLVRERLQECGISIDQELLVRRIISRSGRNRVYINDQMATLQQLQQLLTGLLTVSGQHEHQLLLDPQVHLGLLDSYADLEVPCREMAALHGTWVKSRERLRALRAEKQQRQEQLEWMRLQLAELEAAGLQPDEDTTLQQERNLLLHAATLHEVSQGAHRILYADSGAVLEKLVQVEKDLETLIGIDQTQHPLLGHLEQARIHLEELAHSLQQYAQGISVDPYRLSAVEERLAVIERLGRKHGGDLPQLLERIRDLREALAEGDEAGSREETLEQEVAQQYRFCVEKAQELSRARREAAVRLAAEIEGTLGALDMAKASFSVCFDDPGGEDRSPESRLGPRGSDRVEFLLSANPGEDLKPLARVASGGELSRILLAMKSLLSFKGQAETAIFDEVDAGIGGRTAELVGMQLKRLAAGQQVICITHLPQIACYGDHHFKVTKKTRGEETETYISSLAPEERVEEVARMLGGISISRQTRAHAREILERAQQGLAIVQLEL